jgi:hypothetical protein
MLRIAHGRVSKHARPRRRCSFAAATNFLTPSFAGKTRAGPPVAVVRRVSLAVQLLGSAVFTITTGSAMLSEK